VGIGYMAIRDEDSAMDIALGPHDDGTSPSLSPGKSSAR
jgi:hypothetical protein